MKGKHCTCRAYKKKMAPVLESYNSVFLRFCQELEISSVWLLGIKRVS